MSRCGQTKNALARQESAQGQDTLSAELSDGSKAMQTLVLESRA